MIISFGWTSPALLAGRKTVTRRDWNDDYADRFYEGQIVDAWNTSPRNIRGNPRKSETKRLTQKPLLEYAIHAPPEDWEGEGFAYLTEIGFKVHGQTPKELWDSWKWNNPPLYVVRFEVVKQA